MLYESTYNQYFLEHSWGPWKKHLYISRDGESGHFKYTYPKKELENYRNKQLTYQAAFRTIHGSGFGKNSQESNHRRSLYKKYQNMSDEELAEEYYDSTFDKVINNSVKAAVNALNFSVDMKNKAEGYLNRFANAVKDAWNGAKSEDRTRVQAGKKFVSDLWDYTKNTVTAKNISSSIQNLVKGAGEAVKKTWNNTKNKVNDISARVGENARSLKEKTNDKLNEAMSRVDTIATKKKK